jgi:hypothetical protein
LSKLPKLYPTPFRQYWAPALARVYGFQPDRMDTLTHAELDSVMSDIKAMADGA